MQALHQEPNPLITSCNNEQSTKAYIILQAARKIFLEHGFNASTTDMIQRAANVSKSTIYAHFKDKEALFTAVIEAECKAFTSTLCNMKFYKGELKEMLNDLARSYLDVVLAQSGLDFYRVVIAESHRFPKLAQTYYSLGPKVIISLLTTQLDQAEQAGELKLDGTTPEIAATQFINLIRSEPQLKHLTKRNNNTTPDQTNEWIDTTISLFIRAYGNHQDTDFNN